MTWFKKKIFNSKFYVLMALTLSIFFHVKILVCFHEILGIYFRDSYIPFYYYFTPQLATGYTKNQVKTKKVLEKKGKISA